MIKNLRRGREKFINNYLINNKIFQTLEYMKLTTSSNIQIFHPTVRDNHEIKVLKCKKTKCFFLSSTSHIEKKHYSEKKKFKYFGNNNIDDAQKIDKPDSIRRSKYIKNFVKNKKWVDVGTGSGGLLAEFQYSKKNIEAVEPNRDMRDNLKSRGFKIYKDINDLNDNTYDLITLFHVYEHISDPLDFIKILNRKLKPNGKIIIEVPHAEDILIKIFNLNSFKKFTFWSEHLILHSKKTLKKFIEYGDFKIIQLDGIQRYNLMNHLYWISKNKPGGHIKLKILFKIINYIYDKI